MNKTLVIYHRADFDGIFCREIARKFLPDAELVGWDYGDSDAIVPPGIDKIYMLDISVEAWMKDPRLVWIDHHKSAMEKYGNDIVGYRIDGVAACRLAWQWFDYQSKGLDGHRNQLDPNLPTKEEFVGRTVTEPLAVRLAGEYDIWDKRDERADVFQFGLRSRELSDLDWSDILAVSSRVNPDGSQLIPLVVCDLLGDGSLLQNYQQRNDAGMMERSFMVEFEGLRFLAITTARCNSLSFASKDVLQTGHDALMGFYYTGKEWGFSLYHANHRKDLDLSVIAVKYGGGGHRGACGFRVSNLKDMPFLA